MDSGSDLQPATIHGASDIPGVPRFESAPPTMGFLTTLLGCTVMLIIGLRSNCRYRRNSVPGVGP